MNTNGIYNLDRERELSMADEGGAAAAWIEGVNSLYFTSSSSLEQEAHQRKATYKWFSIGIPCFAVLGGLGYLALRRSSSEDLVKPDQAILDFAKSLFSKPSRCVESNS